MRFTIYRNPLVLRATASALALLIALPGCTTPAADVREVAPPPARAATTPRPPPATTSPPLAAASPPSDVPPVFRPAAWNELPGWREDDLTQAWSAYTASCKVLGSKPAWRSACAAAGQLQKPSAATVRTYFEQHFAPYLAVSSDGIDAGLMTGYYEPLLRGSRSASARFKFPLYGVPGDLLAIEAADVYPEVKGLALRGRVEGRRVVPYYDRARIESSEAPLRGKEIAWIDDPIDVFFLHVQGSGRVVLPSGEHMRVGFADHNGRPYRSIGRVLIERGQLTADQASMQGIKAWAAAHPRELRELLDNNPRYVFFRELPVMAGGPPGALGVPLTARRSLAVDARYMPLGAPVFVETTWPNTSRPLNQLMFAHDTGGAIRGAIRGDFFWGLGEEAEREAGRMRQRTRMWLLLPKGMAPPDTAG